MAQVGTLAPSPARYTVSADSGIYSKLRGKTDFDLTDAGRILNKYLSPLAGISLDEHTKFKAALAQAQAQEGLTADRVLATFDGLLVALNDESKKFEDTATGMTSLEIHDRQEKVQSIAAQIVTLERQKEQLSTELSTAQNKIDSARAGFSSAVTQRESELRKQKEHFTTLLQG